MRELQDRRKQQAKALLDKAARRYIQAVHDGTYDNFDPAALGLEFSLEQIEVRAMAIDPNLFAEYEQHLRDQAAKKAA